MRTSLDRLRGKTALVTGASRGIGEAVARRLAGAGLRVALCARSRERLEALAADLTAAGADAIPLAVDLRDEAAILAAFGEVRERWGGVDVLINNAGLGHVAPLAGGATELWREMLEVNVLALCICTREALADMRARGDIGHVVHVSSMAGHRVPPGSGVYSATKYAVRSLTEALRRELREQGSAIRVASISPGLVETGFHAAMFGDEELARRRYGEIVVLTADDVADAVEYVLAAPPHVQVHDVLVRPTEQAF